MDVVRISYIEDFNKGHYNGTRTDSVVNISTFNHPALVPNRQITGATTYNGPALFGGSGGATLSGGNAFVNLPSTGGPTAPNQVGVLYTAQAGDYLQIATTTQIQVDIRLLGTLQAGISYKSGDTGIVANAIRNGCIAQVLVDGVVQASVDTCLASPTVTLYLDGNAHTIRVKHTGLYNTAIAPISPIVATVGTSVASGLTVTPTAAPTFVAASWRIVATTSGGAGTGKYRIDKANPPAPGAALSYSTIQSNLDVGTTYTGASYVPGCATLITGTLTSGDAATFTSDVVLLAIESAVLSTGSGFLAGTYQALFDLGRSDAQPFLVEWTQNISPSTLAAQQSPPDLLAAMPVTIPAHPVQLDMHVNFGLVAGVPPVTIIQNFPPIAAVTVPSTGEQRGVAGLQVCAQRRFLSLQWTFPTVSTVSPWIRDIKLYSWLPSPGGDPALLGMIALPIDWTPGPIMQAYVGALATFAADHARNVQLLTNGYSIETAEDQYLTAHGANLGLMAYSGEPPAAYRTRLQIYFQSRSAGGSLPFICAQLAELINGTPSAVATSVVSGKTVSTAGGVTVAQTTSQGFTVTVPAPTAGAYSGLPTLALPEAQAEITDCITHTLTPVNSVVTIVYL